MSEQSKDVGIVRDLSILQRLTEEGRVKSRRERRRKKPDKVSSSREGSYDIEVVSVTTENRVPWLTVTVE